MTSTEMVGLEFWGWWLGRCNTKNRVPTRRGSQSYWNSKPKISTTTSFPQVKLFPDARPHLTSTQKECVNGSLSLGRSVAEIAEILGIDERRVYRYQRTFRIHSHAFPPTKMRQNCRKITEYIMERSWPSCLGNSCLSGVFCSQIEIDFATINAREIDYRSARRHLNRSLRWLLNPATAAQTGTGMATATAETAFLATGY
ncbi:hypothetical protein MGG_16007 [Pyricularia oryzae 70-15]|uniref:Uncharacterized protein n=3 Tax=Pyricularia oryzae TaxID=318829 RepID=G4MMU3_PYRO7|nr:uncharacterized protein MGG_16007 [Pyricularia oryzae 70-15]EHA56173.1 hypothetical protein MGG_16007 [Pyricularia oryzae 70-15]ELQ35969.1 hypothetical protein OOU_Y34scaffold00676g15 [Pyricularia oryzae Y34]